MRSRDLPFSLKSHLTFVSEGVIFIGITGTIVAVESVVSGVWIRDEINSSAASPPSFLYIVFAASSSFIPHPPTQPTASFPSMQPHRAQLSAIHQKHETSPFALSFRHQILISHFLISLSFYFNKPYIEYGIGESS